MTHSGHVWDKAEHAHERANMIVHTPLLPRRPLDFGAAEQDLLVRLQLRGSALERPGGLHGHRHGDDRRVGRHFLLFTATRFIEQAISVLVSAMGEFDG